ncbi:hypothetical protein [Stagnihabitans tardus]|uniref:Lipoprotein n=1 Tax=Stagnihabitans tardus TaxID=2699202 RepID=A0AAE5BVX3_9RHOB|nr:hypothetical protein [Stagnihabitans tardus]NBZ87708.1 hypothetical protein [Stagnihabitans tardus]
MRRRFLILGGLVGGMTMLASCGGRLNPFNWFRRRKPEVVDQTGFTAPEDPRGLMERVTSVKVEETSTGVILRATGLAPAQGYHDAELVGLPLDAEGVKVFEFRVTEPLTATGPGPERSRTITVAAALSFYQLDQIAEIQVRAATNAVVVRP